MTKRVITSKYLTLQLSSWYRRCGGQAGQGYIRLGSRPTHPLFSLKVNLTKIKSDETENIIIYLLQVRKQDLKLKWSAQDHRISDEKNKVLVLTFCSTTLIYPRIWLFSTDVCIMYSDFYTWSSKLPSNVLRATFTIPFHKKINIFQHHCPLVLICLEWDRAVNLFVLVFHCCHNKLPQIQWLTTARIYYLTVL